jgi:hypothetical protein
MLEELTDHIMDIAMNSVRAGSKNVHISVISRPAAGTLTISIVDDGSGMDADMVQSVTDPFFSTKEGKKVGLGVPLLKGAAETCGGAFHLKSAPGKGTEIEAVFPLDNPDVPPLGNVREAILLLCVTNPEVRFSYRSDIDGKDFEFDTREINDVLGGLPINHPEVVTFLTRYIKGQP